VLGGECAGQPLGPILDKIVAGHRSQLRDFSESQRVWLFRYGPDE